MSLRVNNNIAALNAYRNLSVTDTQQGKQLEKLSSGFRINRAADDAAGLSISEGLRSQVSGLNVAVRNAQDGISLTQTAEGALSETTSLLQRVRDLSVQSANGTNNAASRKASADEAAQAMSEIDRISSATRFGGKSLLDGSQAANGVTFQVGADATPTSNQVNVKIGDMSTKGLGLSEGTGATAATLTSDRHGAHARRQQQRARVQGRPREDLKATLYNATHASAAELQAAVQAKPSRWPQGRYTVGSDMSITANYKGDAVQLTTSASNTFGTLDATAGAGTGKSSISTLVAYGRTSAIDSLDTAVSAVSSQRATLGAYQNRLEHTIANLSVTAENLSASESRIRDADMAKEMVSYTRTQILSQAGTAMLAQANQSSQGVLSLLRG